MSMLQSEKVNNPLKRVDFNWATPKAVNFLRSQAKLSMFVGGVRSSKTFTGAVKGCLIALRYAGSLGICMSPTYAMLSDVMIPTYADILTKWFGLQLKTDFTVRESSRPEIKIKGAGEMKFRSGETPERIEGLTADWYHLDEAAQMVEKVFKICTDRTSRPRVLPRGIGWLTTTPKGHNWVYERFNDALTDEDYYAETILTSEAGLVTQEEIEYARNHLDPRYFRQQYQATFEHWAGLIYDDFTREKNVKKLEYNPNLINYIGIDPGWSDETAILWYQHNPVKGEWFLLREFVESQIRIETLAKVIIGHEVRLSGGRHFQAPFPLKSVEKIYPGTDINNRLQAADGISIRDLLVNQGVDRGYFRVKRHRKFESILSVRAKILGADGVVRLHVDPSCKRYIADKESFHYKETDGVVTGELPDDSDENHRYSHTNDSEMYVIDSVEPAIGKKQYGGLS